MHKKFGKQKNLKNIKGMKLIKLIKQKIAFFIHVVMFNEERVEVCEHSWEHITFREVQCEICDEIKYA